MNLNDLLLEPVDWRFREFPNAGVTVGEIGRQDWTLFGDDLMFPTLVLKDSALAHNLQAMARWCQTNQVSLAPHGKTTMAPQLFARQLEAGAWGMTAASVAHARMYRAFGVSRILIANEVVGAPELRWLAEEMAADPAFDVYCYADSVRGVELMSRAFADSPRPLSVLVELGTHGGRAGCRTFEAAESVARAIARAPRLLLAGVGGYEGILASDRTSASVAVVDAFCDRLTALYERLAKDKAWGREPIVTAGGSAFPDRVVQLLASLRQGGAPARIVIRPGCYITHDDGFYDAISPFSRDGAVDLRPALELWGAVLSRPAPDLAIVGFGKRDAPFDLGPPIPHEARGSSGEKWPAIGMKILKLNDQHAYLELPREDPLEVGDRIGCGISHPCAAFDRWPLIPMVDDEYRITGAVRTFF